MLSWCSRLGVSEALYPLLAAVDPLDGPSTVFDGQVTKIFGMNARDVVLLAGMALLFGAALFLWAYLTRKKRRLTIGLASRAIYRAEPKEEREEEEEEDSERRRYRKKRRRRHHPELLPRNPTLQETGGLPPLRPEEPAEPTQ